MIEMENVITPDDEIFPDNWEDSMAQLCAQPAGTRVITRLPSGRKLAEVLLANWRQHRVSVPLDPGIPKALATHTERHSMAQVVMDEQGLHLTDKWWEEERERWSVVVHGPTGDLHGNSEPEPALILYTSGSTGAPKGVVLSRHAVETNARAAGQLHRFHRDQPHGTCLPLFHCNAICLSLIASELFGNEVLFTSTHDMAHYLALLDLYHVEMANIVPGLLQILVTQRPQWPAKLRYLLTAAAPLTSALAQQFYDLYGPNRLVQGYGVTEAVNFSCTMPPELTAEEWCYFYLNQHPPVGPPVAGTQVGLRDDGEVVVKGPNNMLGYWRDEAATAKAIDAEGYLHTGDTGYFLFDYPFLVLNGRCKETINRGGETRFPIDVEEELIALIPGLVKGTAFRVPDGFGGDEIGFWHPGNLHPDDLLDQLAAVRSKTRPMLFMTGPGLPRTATHKPQRNKVSDRVAVRTEPPAHYESLRQWAADAAYRVSQINLPTHTPQLDYIRAEAELLLAMDWRAPTCSPATPVRQALALLASSFAQLAAGQITGPEVISQEKGLWSQLMCEYPMGIYAELMAQHLIKNELLNGKVLELGAGVGNTSRLIASHVNDQFIRSDLHPQLLAQTSVPGRIANYNFDLPVINSLWHQEFDLIFGTNTLHCARDVLFTLRQLYKLLVPGGRIVLAEGSPYTTPDNQPWALNMLFGLFPGWYDRGGFKSRGRWLSWLVQAGFRNWGYAQYRAGRHDLGGLIWAQRP